MGIMNDQNDNARTLQSYRDKTQEYVDGTPAQDEAGKSWIDQALKQIPNDGKILEIGSGFGRDAEYIRSQGFNLECSDAVPNFIEILQHKGFNARAIDVLTDDLGRDYDMVFADGVLLHFTPEQSKTVIKKIHAALQENGVFAFSIKKGNGGKWTDEKLGAPRYFYYWQPEDLKNLLKECGFEWLDVAESYTAHNNADWMRFICKKVSA